MPVVRVLVPGGLTKAINIPDAATLAGATIGTDLKLADGSVATLSSLAAALAPYLTTTTTQAHRLLAGLTIGDDHPQYTRKDTLTARGDLYVEGASTVGRLAVGTASQFLQSNGTDPGWATISPVITLGTDLSGSATLTNLTSAALNATIVANAVTDSKLRQSAGLSVIGRSANSTGNVADITAGTDGDVLRRSGTSIGFGNIGANPSASVGLSAVNGSANTYLRSDAAPALNVSISPTWTGTHTFSNTPVVPNASWTYAKIQNVSATSRFLGRISAGSGTIEELTGTQATSLLNVFTSSLQGLVPASGGGTSNFLRADGTFAVPSGTTTGANPSASIGLSAVNGSATTFMRSDAAPALSQSISPTWTGTHTFATQPSFTKTTTGGQFSVLLTAASPGIRWQATGQAADTKNWDITVSGTTLLGRIDNDISSAQSNWLKVTRSGNTVSAMEFGNATGNPTYSFLGTGTSTFGGAVSATGTISGSNLSSSGGANPSASIGLSAINGSAITFMRSDGAPAIDQSISPTWTGIHTFTQAMVGLSSGFMLSSVAPGFIFRETDGGTHQQYWRQYANGAAMNFGLINDTASSENLWLKVSRSGNALSDITFGYSSTSATYTFNGTGNMVFKATTTGAQTATFSATNKPGSGTAGVIAWLPVLTAGGTQGYIPIFGA